MNRIRVIERQTGKSVPLTRGAKLLAGSPLCNPWRHLRLEHLQVVPFENPEAILERCHLIGMVSHGRPCVEWVINGHVSTHTFRPQELSLLPMGPRPCARSPDEHEAVVAAIDHDFVVNLAIEAGFVSNVELVRTVPISDPLLASCLHSLKDEIESGFPGGKLYGDSLTHTIAIRLLTHYSTVRRSEEHSSNHKLEGSKLKSAIDYLKEHFQEDISLSQLAVITHLSPNHFLRMFKAATSLTPHQYLIHYRIKLSRELLLRDDLSIKQVAKEVGFCDASHFARYFKRIMGVSPHQYTKAAGSATIEGHQSDSQMLLDEIV